MKYTIAVLLAGIFAACNNTTQQSNEEVTETNKSSSTPKTTELVNDQKPGDDLQGCYMKVTGRDTAIVMIDQAGNEISGKMLYDNYEKDGSHGTVKGKQEGDVLKLFYDFNSEGMHSVMEVYFKKVPGGILRGVGDMDVKADTTYFTSGVNYSDKEAFSKINCDLVNEKMKW